MSIASSEVPQLLAARERCRQIFQDGQLASLSEDGDILVYSLSMGENTCFVVFKQGPGSRDLLLELEANSMFHEQFTQTFYYSDEHGHLILPLKGEGLHLLLKV